MQPQLEPLFLADDGTYVDVTDFVRFELSHGDIRYGVLDLIVHFTYRGRRAQCYLLHFFRWTQSKKMQIPLSQNGRKGLSFRQPC